MKDILINLTIDNWFRNPFHWGILKFRGQSKKTLGIIYYKTLDVFSPDKAYLTIFFFYFWKWKKKFIFKKSV
jgi:hypothetical protein